jgi:hypothetical protein
MNPSEIDQEAPLDASVEWVKVASEENPEAGNGSAHPEETGGIAAEVCYAFNLTRLPNNTPDSDLWSNRLGR